MSVVVGFIYGFLLFLAVILAGGPIWAATGFGFVVYMLYEDHHE